MKKVWKTYGFRENIFEEFLRRSVPRCSIPGTNITDVSFGFHHELWVKEFSSLIPYNIGLILGNKNFAREILTANRIPVAPGASFGPTEEHDAALFAKSIAFPVMLRQENAWRPESSVRNLRSLSAVKAAFRTLAGLGESILVEKQLHGREYRVGVSDTGYITMCSRVFPTSAWRPVRASDMSNWKTLGNKILRSFPGLRLVIFQCIRDRGGKIYVTDLFTAIGASSEFPFSKGKEKIAAAKLFVDMIFPETRV